MRVCDACGIELKSYGTITYSPEKGNLQSKDVCDLCGGVIFDEVKERLRKLREGREELKNAA